MFETYGNLSRAELQLAVGRIRPLFMRYAMPGVIAMLFMALQGIVDGLIVGRFLGAKALAAVNIASPVYTFATAIALIIGVGSQAQIGLNLGAGEYTKAKTALRSGLTGLMVFSIVSALFVNLIADSLVRVLGADDELVETSSGYVYGLMPWLVGLAASLFFDYILKALGQPRFAMTVMVSTIIINIFLSILFVGKMGMGTFGAGMGTGVSFSLGAIVSGLTCYNRIRNNRNLYKARSRFSLKELGYIFYNGSSEGLTEIALGFTMFLFNITLMKYVGSDGVAAFTIVGYLVFVGVSVALGVSNGVIPIISYNYGAGLITRVKRVILMALGVNTVFGIFFALILWLGGRSIVCLFIDTTDTDVIELATTGARFMAMAFLFNGINIFAASYYTAIDRPSMSLVVASLRSIIFLTAGILLLPQYFGVDGIWATTLIAEILTLVVVCIIFKYTRIQTK
ncbi:MATE family efflux transporter [Xylanibacter rodentium]|uniref:MATE family efflux transporter n=1 Tax=Xylanibacter rodentium TaxID=2736289 RepID=UPI0011DCFCE2|nr:MATE family efflux transporter [Xylanibacter rodentium]